MYEEDAEAYNFWYAAGSMRSLESFVVVLGGDEDWGSAVRELSRGLGIVIGRQVEVAAAQLDYVWRSGPGWESLGHGAYKTLEVWEDFSGRDLRIRYLPFFHI
jgi:hypothetical protein